MADRARIWVGIDVGKAAHHAYAVDETGRTVFSQRLANSQTAIEQVIARASKAAADVRWAVDMTSGPAGLLVALLVATGQPVGYVTGRMVNRLAGAFGGEGKSDAKDARIIAETSRLRSDIPGSASPTRRSPSCRSSLRAARTWPATGYAASIACGSCWPASSPPWRRHWTTPAAARWSC